MADVQLGQGMVRPGAWAVGGVLHRQEFTAPDEAHRCIPEMWSTYVTEAHAQQLRFAQLALSTPATIFVTSTNMAYSTSVMTPTIWSPASCQHCTNGIEN